MQSKNLRKELKERVAKGLHFGIEAMEDSLDSSSSLYNDFVLLKSTSHDMIYVSPPNTLPYEQLEIGLNKLRAHLLKLIDRIDDEAITASEISSNLKLQDLPNRRTNLFKLLDIHFRNLETIRWNIEYDVNSREVYTGREAIARTYWAKKYNFPRVGKPNDPDSKEDVTNYFQDFFGSDKGVYEVYFNNIRHMLEYTLESEVEQSFFLHIIGSLLSRHELVMALYYALSGLDPAFADALRKSKLLDDTNKELLISPKHLNWL